MTGLSRDLVTSIIQRLNSEDIDALTLVCKSDNNENLAKNKGEKKEEEIPRDPVFPSPEFVALEQSISRQLESVQETERPLLAFFLRYIFGKILVSVITVEGRKKIDLRLMKFALEDLFKGNLGHCLKLQYITKVFLMNILAAVWSIKLLMPRLLKMVKTY